MAEFPPYIRHSDTSLASAAHIADGAPTLRGQVYRFIHKCRWYGATDHEVQDQLDMNPSTQRPRRIELVKRGLVKDSGRRRPTHTGRKAVVWIATGQDL
jgi:hypothetical protein